MDNYGYSSSQAQIKSVDVTPCKGNICVLERGSNVSIKVTFIPKQVMAKGKVVVHGVIAGVPIPFPPPVVDACQNSGLTCPLASGTPYTYTAVLPVLKVYPSVKCIVKWELRDQKGEDVFCWEMAAQIK
ncbi:PREDICTED: epididymal secretory protein E1-like [Priapulus caudatus]|uniref:Epididymal secretory protein E1-like n=1 Tax=Priapulus caudatus TaxID=37621 RepID=A0ABM1DT85_PRICU|nr:PREDICTED: epididymal secretory protein E1-like [Priapulus caudatus]